MRVNFFLLFVCVVSVSCTLYPMARNACTYALRAAVNGANRATNAPTLRRFSHAIDFDDFEKMPPKKLYQLIQSGEVTQAAPPTEFCSRTPHRPSIDKNNAPGDKDPWLVSIEFTVVSKAHTSEQVEEAAQAAFTYGATRVAYYKKP